MELRTKAEVNSFNNPEIVELKTDLENILKFRHWEGESSKIKQNSDVITSHTHKVTLLGFFIFVEKNCAHIVHS